MSKGVTIIGLLCWEFFSLPCAGFRGPCDCLPFRSCQPAQPLTLLERSYSLNVPFMAYRYLCTLLSDTAEV